MESESLSWNTAELKDLRVLREIYIYTFFSKKTTKKKSSLGFCNALSWVLRARSSRKLSETSSLKASATSVSKISATLAIATAFCRFNPNLFASFYNFFFFVLILWLGFQFLMEFVFHRELEFFLFGLPYLKSRF